jgi:hypothetical protein
MILYLLLLAGVGGFILYKDKLIYSTNIILDLIKYKHDYKFEALKLNRKLLIVPYRYMHHEYYAFLPVKKPRVNIISIISKQDDVTYEIKKYLGRNCDFSGVFVTPQILGYESLEFKFIENEGTIKTKYYSQNETINFVN